MSKPTEDYQQAGELDEAIKQMSVVLVANDQPTEVLQPGDASLDDPASLVTSELATILSGWLHSILAVRTDQFGSSIDESLSYPVRVRRFVIQNVIGHAVADTHIDQSFERVDLRMVGPPA